MAKWLLIVLVPVALAGCVTEQRAALPMALAPSDTAQAACLTYAGAPSYGDCDQPAAVSVPPETN
jgi:hypothetical protein